jgi:hypothetical protein
LFGIVIQKDEKFIFSLNINISRTDVIQIMMMYGTLVLIILKGTYDVGGLSVVLERNLQSGRLSAPE